MPDPRIQAILSAGSPEEWEARYRGLGRLLESVPDLTVWPWPVETHLWLGRAHALVEEVDAMEAIALQLAMNNAGTVLGSNVPHEIISILYRALGKSELRAPARVRGTFIPAGGAFDAYGSISKVFQTARSDLLIVDPYLDDKLLTDFLGAAPEGVALRVLTDEFYYQKGKAMLQTAAVRWIAQYGTKHPLEVRVTAPRLLHDRAILVDGTHAWTLTQSFKDFANRAHGEIVRVDDIAAVKIAANEGLWSAAAPLT